MDWMKKNHGGVETEAIATTVPVLRSTISNMATHVNQRWDWGLGDHLHQFHRQGAEMLKKHQHIQRQWHAHMLTLPYWLHLRPQSRRQWVLQHRTEWQQLKSEPHVLNRWQVLHYHPHHLRQFSCVCFQHVSSIHEYLCCSPDLGFSSPSVAWHRSSKGAHDEGGC